MKTRILAAWHALLGHSVMYRCVVTGSSVGGRTRRGIIAENHVDFTALR